MWITGIQSWLGSTTKAQITFLGFNHLKKYIYNQRFCNFRSTYKGIQMVNKVMSRIETLQFYNYLTCLTFRWKSVCIPVKTRMYTRYSLKWLLFQQNLSILFEIKPINCSQLLYYCGLKVNTYVPTLRNKNKLFYFLFSKTMQWFCTEVYSTKF